MRIYETSTAASCLLSDMYVLGKMTVKGSSLITVTGTKSLCMSATHMTIMQGLEISELVTKREQDYEILNMMISTATCKEMW